MSILCKPEGVGGGVWARLTIAYAQTLGGGGGSGLGLSKPLHPPYGGGLKTPAGGGNFERFLLQKPSEMH